MTDAYEICRFVKRYTEKNGCLPTVSQLGEDAPVAQLVSNGVVELRSLYEGGPAIKVALTDKGMRMARDTRRRR